MHFWKWLTHFFAPSHHNEHRPYLLRRPWLIVFLSITLATEGFLVANLIARQSSQNFLAAVVPGEIIALTNDERQQNAVGHVTENMLLDDAAQAKANDMAKLGYFSHTGPDGKTPWQWIAESGYEYQYAGENLAVRFVDSQDVINAWMQSPTHRENIVKPVYTQIGVGVAQGVYDGQPATYVVQYFGTPLASAEPASSLPQLAQAAPAASQQTVAPAQHAAAAPTTAAGASVAQQAAPAVLAAQNQVKGAEIAVPVSAPTPTPGSFVQSFVRQVLRALSEPSATSNGILGGIAVLLSAVIALTFFMHIQIQHPRMLAAGATVAATAALFFMLNLHLAGLYFSGSQAASAALAGQQTGVVIDSQAASVGFAVFPQ